MHGSGSIEAVEIGDNRLQGLLGMPEMPAKGLVIFAHGSGSGRLSPRNQHVAEGLRRSGLATLLLDCWRRTRSATGPMSSISSCWRIG
jgi:predicted alpha/beta-hydrolase family hydrolase